ncbi:MAG: J domain-containing protein [Proteobacteria bacterium]|nr:J domain-containing protein [Pseudomonadota bacterium]
MSKDPYTSLGLKKTATADEIKKAYRKIARTSHPDLNPDDASAELRFKEASAAYDLLKDPEQRARFDRGEIDASGAEQQPERKFYREYAQKPDNPYQSGQQYEGFGDASDVFAEILRQRAQGGRQSATHGFNMRGQDRRYALEIPFMDAVLGGKTRITLPDGGVLDVKIPQGTADQQTIRLRGKGEPGFEGGPTGDALVTLSVRPHPTFRREGNDILITLPITLDEAVLGGKVETPTIDGNVKLNIPKGASSGQILRMRGRGVKSTGKVAGDQRVELRIVAPDKIDEKLEEFMESWRKTNAYDPRKGIRI